QAEIEEKNAFVTVTTARLARQAEELHQQERVVTEQRGEMTRHLSDMREWYRKKLRELAGVHLPPEGEPSSTPQAPNPSIVSLPAALGSEALPIGTLVPIMTPPPWSAAFFR